MQCGILLCQRKCEQQSRDELRREAAVDLYVTAVYGSLDLYGQVAAAVAYLHAETPQRFDHHHHRPVEQCALALDADGGGVE